MKQQQSFRLSSATLHALDTLSAKSGKPKTQVLEWLIEQEYRKRIEQGQIPSDQDLFDLFGKVQEASGNGEN